MSDKYIYLNLQEQVGKNKNDIEELRKRQSSLVNARVIGTEASEEDLPNPETYGGQPGDGYLVGTGEPYDLYIFSEPSAGEVGFKWVNVGQYPAPGPQGEEGPEGPQGPQGDASNWRFGTTNPSVLDTDKLHDGYLNTSTGMVYEFDGSLWIPIGSIKGAQGPQGPQGPIGPIGPEGPQGIQGERGPAGMTVVVKDTVASVGALPDPEDVDRNTAYIVDDGNDKDLYIIIGEYGSRSWYNAGAFTGTPGEAAGFGVVAATITALPPSSSPSVNVETDGPDNEKNFTFNFGIPVGADLENSNAFMSSTTKGYTQYVIDARTMKQLIKSPAAIGLTSPANLASVISTMPNLTEAIFGSSFLRTEDLPKESGVTVSGMIHIVKSGLGQYSVEYFADNYNVYAYYGNAGTPSVAVWRRILTLGSGDTTNVPSGGTTGQILAKESDLDYDTTWTDAPTGVPDGGATDQVLAKKSNADGDFEWKTPAPGLPTGGASGQVLAKTSNSDYDVTWITPEEGGGGPTFVKLSENLLINPYFNINQRGSSSWGVGTAGYTCDRWYKYSAGSITRSTSSLANASTMNVLQAKMCQFIETPDNTAAKLLVVIDANESNHTLSGNPIYCKYKDALGSWHTITQFDSGSKARGGGMPTGHKQYFAVFYPTTFAQTYEIGVDLTAEDQGANTVGFTKAACYMIYDWDTDLKDLFFGTGGNGISVPYPNYAEELEKCKYYYEITDAHTPVCYSMAGTSVRSAYIFVNYKKKRVAPTVGGQLALTFVLLNGGPETIAINATYNSNNQKIYGAYSRPNDSDTIISVCGSGTATGISAYMDAEIYP